MHPLFIQSLISAFPHAVHLQRASLPNTLFPHCSCLLSMSRPKSHLLRTTFPVHNSVLYHYTQTSPTSQQGPQVWLLFACQFTCLLSEVAPGEEHTVAVCSMGA